MHISPNIQNNLRNPAYGLVPLFVFSLLIFLIDSRLAVAISLALSLAGFFIVKKYSRLIYDISAFTFGISFLLSFTTLSLLPAFNKFVVVEIIFVSTLIFSRLSRSKLVSRAARLGNPMLKNYLKESLRIAFQTQYGLTFHLLLLFLYFITGNRDSLFVNTTFMILLLQIILFFIMLLEAVRLYILGKKLFKEEWLPVVTESGNVTGKVAKSITKDLKNKLMHPVVRVALMHQGAIYLKERDPLRLLNPGKLDYPFEKYMQFKEDIDETVRKSLEKECGNENNNLPIRFILKYTFENDVTKRLIFLYIADIEDAELFRSLQLHGGKLWTTVQIDDNLGSGIFSECFELEYEYLKNTLLLSQQFKKQ